MNVHKFIKLQFLRRNISRPQRKKEREFGEYRTRRLGLEAWDRLNYPWLDKDKHG